MTRLQQNSLHKMLGELADEMLAAGINVNIIIEAMRNYEVPPTKDNVKELMWRPIQKAVTGKERSSNLTTAEVDKVFEVLQQIVQNELHLPLTFPSMAVMLQNLENIS